jgi:hypothetical protein
LVRLTMVISLSYCLRSVLYPAICAEKTLSRLAVVAAHRDGVNDQCRRGDEQYQDHTDGYQRLPRRPSYDLSSVSSMLAVEMASSVCSPLFGVFPSGPIGALVAWSDFVAGAFAGIVCEFSPPWV